MSIALLLLFLLLGVALGWRFQRIAQLTRANRLAGVAALWSLLAAMGAKLALNREIFSRHPGVFLVAAASSVLLVAVYFALFLLWKKLFGAKSQDTTEVLEAPSGGGHELLAVMKNAGCILGGFLVFLALPAAVSTRVPVDQAIDWILRLLLFAIGFDLGAELHVLDLRKLPRLLLLVPLVNIALTLLCGFLLAGISRLSSQEGLLMVSGMGWYSLSSVMLAERGMALLSVLAFIHNVFRELLSILSAPFAARVSPYLPVYLGGATSMDVMLPFVQRYAGREFTLVSFYSGVICSFAVIPLLQFLARP